MIISSGGLEQDGDALPDAGAHGGQGAPGPAVVELECGGQGQPRPAGAQRVAERDRAAVRVDVLGGVGQGIAVLFEAA